MFERALEYDPNHVAALLGLARAKEELGDAPAAARVLERAIANLQGPDRAPALVQLARLLDGPLEDPDGAEELYHGALTDDPRFELIRGDIAQLETFIDERGLAGKVDGVLFDLGVSSPQLDEADRGFSFLRDGPLDMRMDPESGVPASEWLQSVDEKTLKYILRTYGEENNAARIARAIVTARNDVPFSRTAQLARLIEEASPKRGAKIHPATKTFQAIRIAINDELGQLEKALAAALRVLRQGGRLCVISFHSLEDRIVKRFMRDASREAEQYRGMPNVPEAYRPKLSLVGKDITATDEEVAVNRRARSARLRVAERT